MERVTAALIPEYVCNSGDAELLVTYVSIRSKNRMMISRLFSLYGFVIAYIHVAHGKSHLVFLMCVWVNDGDLGTGTVSVS